MRTTLLTLLLTTVGCQSTQATSSTSTTSTPPPVKVNEVAAALAAGLTLDADDPATCQPCHAQVVAEFQESLHSRAHHANDALYASMRTMRLAKQGPQIAGACANCHSPRDTKDFDSKAARAGVTCATCHQLEGVRSGDGIKGAAALIVGPEKTFRGPHDLVNGTAPLHATGAALPALVDGTSLCLACHGEETNAAGVATCTTGPEYVASKDGRSCTSCHMAEVEGASGAVTTRTKHRSHRFAGPHQQHRLGGPGLLDDAVKLSGRFEGDAVIAVLENTSPHGFPTGFPARVAMLDLRALDATGKELGRNITSDPMKDHPEAVFNRGYVDAEGKPSLAPFAAKQVRDNRLTPAEKREVRWKVPAQTAKVEARLRFFLLAPFAAKQLEYTGPETKPVLLAPVVVSR
ncbi:MAG: multiheme c-type cytochrome [Myxococcales bacterium]|nr:multiheme c-type cytochrome [Myxococcales bacterium]